MNTMERISIITEIVKRNANISKTAIMKFLYLLQTVFSIPLGYDFEIYSYGLYSQAVMSDIEFAYYNGSIMITPKEYENAIDSVVSFFLIRAQRVGAILHNSFLFNSI